MPALPAVPGVIRHEIKYTVGTDIDVLNRSFFAYTGTAPTNTNLSAMAAALHTAWNSDLRALFTAQVTWDDVLLTDLSSSSGAFGDAPSATSGTRSGGNLPAGVAALTNFTVARRYRGGKPRMYMPAGSDTDLANAQTWATAFTNAVTAGWNSYVTALEAAVWSGGTITGQVNVSYYHGFASVQDPVTLRWRNIPTPRATALVDAITSVSTSVKIGSQRKRYVR
jgi:hypothetical protein